MLHVLDDFVSGDVIKYRVGERQSFECRLINTASAAPGCATAPASDTDEMSMPWIFNPGVSRCRLAASIPAPQPASSKFPDASSGSASTS